MLNYLIRRLLIIPVMLLMISLITLGVMHLSPADPAAIQYGLNPEVSATARQQLERIYGLDRPFLVQYWGWLKRVVSLNLGNSFIDGRPVATIIIERLPATLILNFFSLGLIFAVALPVGIISAWRRGSFFDRSMSLLVFIGYSTPTFWLALILIMIFGVRLGWFPISGMRPWYVQFMPLTDQIRDLASRLALPVFATAFGGLAGLSRYARSSVLEVLRQDYIRAARAKGLSERRVVWKHALKNALLPVVTIMGLTLPALIGGSVIFETIFSWPGMGRLGYNAIMNYDYPVVMGVGVLSAFLTLVGILISDMLYAWIDPRIRYR